MLTRRRALRSVFLFPRYRPSLYLKTASLYELKRERDRNPLYLRLLTEKFLKLRWRKNEAFNNPSRRPRLYGWFSYRKGTYIGGAFKKEALKARHKRLLLLALGKGKSDSRADLSLFWKRGGNLSVVRGVYGVYYRPENGRKKNTVGFNAGILD